jgi:hypothetical protein
MTLSYHSCYDVSCCLSHIWANLNEPGSSVSTVSNYGLDGRCSIPDRGRGFFPLISASRPALEPTQPPIQWVPGALSPRVKRGRGVMLTTHPLLVPRLRKSRSYTSCHPDAPLCSVTGPLYLSFLLHPTVLILNSCARSFEPLPLLPCIQEGV